MADGYLNFDTKINESGFNSGISKLGGIAKGGLQVLAGAVVGVATAMGAGVALGVKYNSSIETYQTSFEVMTGSAEKAAEVIANLKKVGADTPFELGDLADTTQLLMNYGMTADDAQKKLMMLGDISQGSAEKMNRIATAYGQMSSAGKVQLEDIKQMIEAGYNPLQEISKSTGESMESLYDRISKGTISVDEITASMERSTSAGGKYFGSMDKQSKTFAGLMSTLKDNAMQLIGGVVEPISASLVSSLLPSAIDAITQLTTAFQENGVDGLISAGGQVISNILLGIAESLPNIINSAVVVINSFVTSLGEQTPALASSGFAIVSALANGILSILMNLYPVAVSIIGAIAQGLIDNLPTLIPIAINMILDFAQWIFNNLPTIIDTGAKIIMAIVQGIVNSLPNLLARAPEILWSIVTGIYSAFTKLNKLALDIIVTLAKGIISSVWNLNVAAAKAFAQMVSDFKNQDWGSIGMNIIKGIGRGLSNAVGFLKDATVAAAKNALDSAKAFLGIHSPSTLFRDEVGKYMALGIGVGFKDNMPEIAMNKSLQMAVNGMQNSVGVVESNVPLGTNSYVSNNVSTVTQESKNDPINYSKLASAVMTAFVSAGITVDVNERTLGTLINKAVIK